MSKEKFKRSLQAELNKVVSGVDKPVADYLAISVAAPMAQAIEDSLTDAAQTDLPELFSTLKSLDSDVQELRRLAGAPAAARTTYESWARYWAAVSPDLEVVRKLVREVVVPKVGAVRDDIADKRALENTQYVFRVVRGSVLPFTERPEDMQTDGTLHVGDLWRKVRTWAEPEPGRAAVRPWQLGSRPGTISLRSDCKDAIDELFAIGRPSTGQQTAFYLPAMTVMSRRFKEASNRCRLVLQVDAEASQHVPNAQFQGFARAFAETSAAMYASAVTSQASSIPIVAKVRGWSGPLGLFDAKLPPLAVVLLSLIPTYLIWSTPLGTAGLHFYSILTFLVLYGVLKTLSGAMLQRKLRDRFVVALKQSMDELDARAADMTAQAIDEEFMDRVLARITVELSPRPLQRALNRSLE